MIFLPVYFCLISSAHYKVRVVDRLIGGKSVVSYINGSSSFRSNFNGAWLSLPDNPGQIIFYYNTFTELLEVRLRTSAMRKRKAHSFNMRGIVYRQGEHFNDKITRLSSTTQTTSRQVGGCLFVWLTPTRRWTAYNFTQRSVVDALQPNLRATRATAWSRLFRPLMPLACSLSMSTIQN